MPAAAMPPPAGPRPPPVNKKGILSRHAVKIPASQVALLNNDAAWFGSINTGDASATLSFKPVPDSVREQLQKQHHDAEVALKKTALASTAPAPAETQDTLPTPTAEGHKENGTGTVAASVEAPEPRLAAAKEIPSATEPASLTADVSPPARAAAPAPAVAAQPVSGNADSPSQQLAGSAAASAEPAGRSGPETPATPEASRLPPAAAAEQARHSPDWPDDEEDEQSEATENERGGQTAAKEAQTPRPAEPAARSGSEIPATPENSLKTAAANQRHASPDCSDSGDEEVAKDKEGHEAGQTAAEHIAATPAARAPAVARRGKSPNLSSSPPDDLEYEPVRALVQRRSPQAAVAPRPPAEPATEPAALSSAANAPPRTAPPMRLAQTQAVPALRQAGVLRQQTTATTASPAHTQPSSASTSRAPSEEGTSGVKHRLMKPAVFPKSYKPKQAANRSRMSTPDSATFSTGPTSLRHLPPARLNLNTAAVGYVNSSPSPTSSDGRPSMDLKETVEAVEAAKVVGAVEAAEAVEAAHAAETQVQDVPMADPAPAPAAAPPTPAVVLTSPAAPAPATVAATRTMPAAVATPELSGRGPLFGSAAASASLAAPAVDSTGGDSPAASPRQTWMLPFEAFVSAYPDYAGDPNDFLSACYYLQGIATARQLASYQYDDVVRSFVDYKEYVQDDVSAAPLSLLQWYFEHVDTLRYTKQVVTRQNIHAVLGAYPDKVQSIKQLAESGSGAGPRRPPAPETRRINTTTAASSQPQSFPAGRRLSLDRLHDHSHNHSHNHSHSQSQKPSQDDSGPPNSLLDLSILGSSGIAAPPPFHPSSQSPSVLTTQDASQDMYAHPGVVVRPDSLTQSSGMEYDDHILHRPNPSIRASAIPAGMDRITYILQSPPDMADTQPGMRPHFPSQSQSQSQGTALRNLMNWTAADDGFSVAETPAPTRAKATRLTKSMVSPVRTPAALAVGRAGPSSRKRSWGGEDYENEENQENQPPSSAASSMAAEDEAAVGSDALGLPVYGHARYDASDFSDDEAEASMLSVQSAHEARHRPPAVQPVARDKGRRVTIAASDIGMVARMAAAEDAQAASTSASAPVAARAAAAGEPPQKKRKKAKAGAAGLSKPFSRKALAEHFIKKAAELGIGRCH